MMKKKVILSYDYELFFGDKSGTVQKTLIEPTNAILDAMDSVNMKGNFFVDWQMLKYLKLQNKERTDADYMLIVEQLHDIVRRGHRIELHIHPHWVDAKYNGDGTWDFSEFRHYSLNSFSEEEIIDMFVEGTDLLTSIARDVDPEYKIVAFRAGGWAIQPFEKVKKGLETVGIYIDSSVMPGRAIKCDYSECDFLDAPSPQSGYYYFSDDVCKEDSNGKFLQIPISSLQPSFIRRVYTRLCLILGVEFDYTIIPDGSHTRSMDNPDVWRSKFPLSTCTFSVVSPFNVMMMRWQSKHDVLCFIEHPKDFSRQTVPGIKKLSKVGKSVLYKDYVSLLK